MDSMGVGAVEIGRIITPDHRRRHQEAPKRCLATPAAFLRFWFGFLRREGGWGSLWLFQVVHCRCRAVKSKIYAGGQKPHACSSTSCYPELLKLIAPCRGIIR